MTENQDLVPLAGPFRIPQEKLLLDSLCRSLRGEDPLAIRRTWIPHEIRKLPNSRVEVWSAPLQLPAAQLLKREDNDQYRSLE